MAATHTIAVLWRKFGSAARGGKITAHTSYDEKYMPHVRVNRQLSMDIFAMHVWMFINSLFA